MTHEPSLFDKPAPATVRCARSTTVGGNGFCLRHQNRRVHNGREWQQVDARPLGELPFDPSSSAFCRALVRRRASA